MCWVLCDVRSRTCVAAAKGTGYTSPGLWARGRKGTACPEAFSLKAMAYSLKNHVDRHRRIARVMFLWAFLLLVAPGCSLKMPSWPARAWINGYQEAETLAHQRGTGMIICYRDTPPAREDKMLGTTRAALAQDSKHDYVGCILNKSYAWDRNYVAQFGVDRSPALIALHPDGTYQAHVGLLDFDGTRDFLAQANPPGRKPKWNRFLHYEPRYRWIHSLEQGQAIAKQSGRSMLVVYDRLWSKDRGRVMRMFSKPAVYRRFSSMVHVHVRQDWSLSEQVTTPYGTLRLPAIVIAKPDGRHQVLEVPDRYEAIIRFADKAGHPAREKASHASESRESDQTAGTTSLGSE